MASIRREEVATKSDLAVLRAEFKSDLGVLKGELLAAMKADKIDFLKWVVMLIVGQTAVFSAGKLLGHVASGSHSRRSRRMGRRVAGHR
jgi:hypothetical protein